MTKLKFQNKKKSLFFAEKMEVGATPQKKLIPFVIQHALRCVPKTIGNFKICFFVLFFVEQILGQENQQLILKVLHSTFNF